MSEMYVTNDGQRIVVPYHEALARAIPHALKVSWQGEKYLALPNQADEARVARNLGVPVPPPIETRYDWRKTQPWKIQRITAALLAESPRCYVLSELGTGKTRAVLYAGDWLMRTKQAKRMLIVAPLSTLTPVWERECFTLMFDHKVRVLHGTRERRLRLLDEQPAIAIINHHGVAVLGEELVKAGFDIVVLDELAVYRNKRTDLWAAASRLIERSAKYAWGLTGAPTPNAPTDAWGQVKLLTPQRTTRSFTGFQDLTMQRVSQFRLVPRSNAYQIVHEAMTPSVRFTRDDVMELPACTVVDREAPLEDDALKAYKMLYAKARMLTEQGEQVSAVNEGVLQSKLLQVSCGYIYTDKRTVYKLPVPRRLSALDEILDAASHKVLVLVPFLHALTGVAEHLAKRDIAIVHGEVGRATRDRIFADFQTRVSPRIIVAHPQCLAHGLTLTQADTVVWYSPTTSLEIYEQANARINRPGQRNKMLIVHLVGTPVERITYTRLKQKARMQGCLLELFAQQRIMF